MKKKLDTQIERHPVDQIPSSKSLFFLGLQHLLIMYSGAIVVPYVIGSAIGLSESEIAYLVSANLLISGAGTIITSIGFWRFGARLPIILGPSANVIAPLIAIGKVEGIAAIWGACIIAGLAMIILAPLFRWITRFFPAVVLGCFLTILGIMLIPIAVKIINEGNISEPVSNLNILFAVITVALIIFFMKVLPALLSQAALLIGLIVASVLAGISGQVHFGDLTQNGWLGFVTPLHFGVPEFDIVIAAPVLLIMLILMLEVITQYTAIAGLVDLPTKDGLSRVGDGVRADGLATLAGGIFGCFPVVTFSQNIGVLGLTSIKSRYVTAMSGFFLILLGIFPPIGIIVAGIPSSVLGGTALVMFATVAVVGIKIMGTVDFNRSENVMVVACALGAGLLPMGAPHFYDNWPAAIRLIMNSPVGAGFAAAIIVNFVLNTLPDLYRPNEEEGVERPNEQKGGYIEETPSD